METETGAFFPYPHNHSRYLQNQHFAHSIGGINIHMVVVVVVCVHCFTSLSTPLTRISSGFFALHHPSQPSFYASCQIEITTWPPRPEISALFHVTRTLLHRCPTLPCCNPTIPSKPRATYGYGHLQTTEKKTMSSDTHACHHRPSISFIMLTGAKGFPYRELSGPASLQAQSAPPPVTLAAGAVPCQLLSSSLGRPPRMRWKTTIRAAQGSAGEMRLDFWYGASSSRLDSTGLDWVVASSASTTSSRFAAQ